MSISGIITRGYGLCGNINLIITRGYLSGTSPVPNIDTHDGGIRKKLHHQISDEKTKNKILLAREQQKLADRELLRKQLHKARYGDGVEINEVVDNINKKLPSTTKSYANPNNIISTLKIALDVIDKEILLLQHQMAIDVEKMRRAREDDDVYAILLTIH